MAESKGAPTRSNGLRIHSSNEVHKQRLLKKRKQIQIKNTHTACAYPLFIVIQYVPCPLECILLILYTRKRPMSSVKISTNSTMVRYYIRLCTCNRDVIVPKYRSKVGLRDDVLAVQLDGN